MDIEQADGPTCQFQHWQYFSLNLEGEMKGGLILVAFLYWVCSGQAFWLDLDLELDTALSRSKQAFDPSRNTGQYLRDSFRKEVLNPSLDKIVKAIKTIQKSDQRNEGILMAISAAVILTLGYLATSLKCQRKKKLNSVVWTKKVAGSETTAETENLNVKIASA